MLGIFKPKKTPAPEKKVGLSDAVLTELHHREVFGKTMTSPTFRDRFEAQVARKHEVRDVAREQEALDLQRLAGNYLSANMSGATSTKNPCGEIILKGSISASEIVSGSISADKISIGSGNISSITSANLGSVKYDATTGNWTYQDHYDLQNGEPEMAKQPLTIEEKERLMDVGRRIIALAKEKVFEVDGIPTLTVKQHDGQYRKKAMSPTWGFYLIDMYIGSRETPIFVFEPVDSLPFETVEASIKEADTTFPLLGGVLAQAAEITTTENLGGLFGILENQLRKEAEAIKAADQAAVVDNPNWGRF
jgi:hypothetical protein